MRFYEYEAREIVRRAGIPVTEYGFTRDPAEAAEIAARIGGPVVVKSQVLSGGGGKGGGGRFAPTPPPAAGRGRRQVPGPERRADEGGRDPLRRHARRRRARGARGPRPRDRRPPAARR